MNAEERKHGPNHVGQLIGNLTRQAELQPSNGKIDSRLWGGIAIDRPGDRPAYYVYFLYGGEGVSDEDLLRVKEFLPKGQRVKLQGRLDLRPIKPEQFEELCRAMGLDPTSQEALENETLSEVYYSGRSSIRCYLTPADLDLNKTRDAAGKRPLTLLLQPVTSDQADVGFQR